MSGVLNLKVSNYRVFVPGLNIEVSKTKPLWFSSLVDGDRCDEETAYAAALYKKTTPIFGNDGAVYAFEMYGQLGYDNKALLPGYENFFVINEPTEYYYTDMVFFKQKYEEALMDLHFFRAEEAWSDNELNNRPAVDKAIADTLWVAEQNGVSFTDAALEAKFMASIDKKLAPIIANFHKEYTQYIGNIDEYSTKIVDTLKKYYADPNLDTFENIYKTLKQCGDEISTKTNNKVNYYTFQKEIISRFSPILGLIILLRHEEEFN